MADILAIPSDDTQLEFQGREYGVISRPQERFVQELPQSLLKIGEDIRAESALLRLAENSSPTKPQIFEAYGKDIKLFDSRYEEFRD